LLSIVLEEPVKTFSAAVPWAVKKGNKDSEKQITTVLFSVCSLSKEQIALSNLLN